MPDHPRGQSSDVAANGAFRITAPSYLATVQIGATRLAAVVDRRNIVLTGFMGTGKTTVGRRLADRLGYEFVDTDQLIEQRHGPIAEIFATQGEPAFRAIERSVAAEVANRFNLVVGTGGGMMLDDANAEALSETGDVFALVASADTILARVMGDSSGVVRPLLEGNDPAGRVRQLLAEREAVYARFQVVSTDGRTPAEVADAILALTSQATS